MSENEIDTIELKKLFKTNIIESIACINHLLNDKYEHLDRLDSHVKSLKQNLQTATNESFKTEFDKQISFANDVLQMDERVRSYKVDLHKSTMQFTPALHDTLIIINDEFKKLNLEVKSFYNKNQPKKGRLRT